MRKIIFLLSLTTLCVAEGKEVEIEKKEKREVNSPKVTEVESEVLDKQYGGFFLSDTLRIEQSKIILWDDYKEIGPKRLKSD